MIAFDDDADLIDIGLLLFAEGGMFALENEVLHHAEDELPPVWGGSRKGRAPNINRERVKYAHLLDEDFWGETPQIVAPRVRILLGLLQNGSQKSNKIAPRVGNSTCSNGPK